MRTSVHLWSFLSQFFLEWEMFQLKLLEKINTQFLFNFFRRSCHLWDTMVKYGTAGQATDDNIIGHLCIACWITKATNSHWEYVILIAFHYNNGWTNAPQYYIIRTSHLLSIKRWSLRLLKFLSLITTVRRLTICFTTICPYQYLISKVASNFFLQLCGPATALSRKCLQNLTTTQHFKFFVICIIKLFTIKIEKQHTFDLIY
jgi:hypothetical protein